MCLQNYVMSLNKKSVSTVDGRWKVEGRVLISLFNMSTKEILPKGDETRNRSLRLRSKEQISLSSSGLFAEP